MKKLNSYKCPFCSKEYKDKDNLYSHMESQHEEQLDGLPPAQVFFNFIYKKKYSLCIICRKNHTRFNLIKERYERLCDDPKCHEKYKEQFRNNMKKKYGNDIYKRMNDPKTQKEMLSKRKISGVYTWSTNKKFKFTYTGSYELEFLKFLDTFLNWNPEDLFFPSPVVFKYQYEGKEHFYIPDCFIPSLNLIIEVKSFTNNHYRKRDIEIEKLKDQEVEKSTYNYFKVHDKTYDDFFNYLLNLIDKINEKELTKKF